MKKYITSIALSLTILVAGTAVTSAQTTTTHHRKMSNRAKGAIIGGAGGAVVGGLIGHNVGGALIGAGLGAGGGYVIGDAKDRSNLRKRQAWRRAHPRKPKVVYVKPKSVTTTTTTTTRVNHY
jgi:uncharacterized protein YcfJ